MMITQLTTFVVVFTILSPFIIAEDPCRFSHTKGVIDLTSLAQTDGKPKYADQIPPSGSNYKYSYNPCRAFSEGTACQNVAVCQVSFDGLFQFSLGTQESAVWSAGTGLGSVPQVSYSTSEKKVVVLLQCPDAGEEQFEALGEDPTNNYKFRLTNKCACWNGCGSGPQPTTKSPGPGGEGGGISGGTVFIIILLVLIFVYFVGFAVFYHVREQKTGLELIAHRTFWASLPGYAKDGAVYTYRRVANKGADPYQSV